MKKLLAMTLVLGFSASAMAESFLFSSVASAYSSVCAGKGADCAPIYNAKTEALNYTGGEVSATLQQGINALDANFDTSNLSLPEKIQHIGQF